MGTNKSLAIPRLLTGLNNFVLNKSTLAILMASIGVAVSQSAISQELDNIAPILDTIYISPSTVNTSAGPTSIDLRLVFTDDNPVTVGDLFLENTATNERLPFSQEGDWESRNTTHTGRFSVSISNNENPGLWHVSSIVASDALGNSNSNYDTLQELLEKRFTPFVSMATAAGQVDFDAQIEASATFSQTGQAQTTLLNVTLEDANEYEIWFVPNVGTSFTNIAFSGGISIAQSCAIESDFTKCIVTSSNNNLEIIATVDTTSNDITNFGYSAFVQPIATGSEANWLNNYVEFPRLDFDVDGTPNEQDLDDDNDNIPDIDDLFPLDASESTDADNDGIGDNGDFDDDNDGVPDQQDLFPLDPSENADNDRDGVGNNADDDDDNDGIVDVADAFPFDPTETIDSDGDGIGNNADNDDDNDGGTDDNDAFPLDPTETIDSDGDGIGNNSDPDDDNDGTLDADDAFPRDPTEDTDTDEDGEGNNTDEDDDNDGVRDEDDLFPLDPGDFRDNDQDGIGDNTDNDDDNDLVLDFEDEFPFNPNESIDSDGDGIGNNADLDDDNDGLDDRFDQFPLDPTEVADFDGDGIGNNADDDDDNDGVLDNVDAFRFAVTEWFDTDGDGIGNNADLDDDNDGIDDQFDTFPTDANESVDSDGDGIGNNADTDDDNDGVDDAADAFPLDASEGLDTDGDGIGNNTDDDDDGDLVLDENDLFPLDRNESADNDLDGIGNNTDNDDDNDGVLDSADAFPFDAAEFLDNDNDGVGNNADTDDDNDNFPDTEDAFPFDPLEWSDNDEDGIGDNRDTDDDNDGILDAQDAFPVDPAETLDNDADGIGNNADNDDDNDGVLDDVDAFPFSDDESIDTDGDGIGNNADTDDDNDGIVDGNDSQPLNASIGDNQAPILDGIEDFSIEATGPLTNVTLTEPRVRDNNLNPATLENDYTGPLALGENIVTWTATDFAGNQTDLIQVVTVVDTTPPEFPVLDAIRVVARGFLTDVSQDINLSATDLVDGAVTAVLVTENNLRAGQQSAIVSATDAANNTSMIEVFLNIEPSFVVKPTAIAGPGNSIELPVSLSGKAAIYPATLEYSVVGPVTSQTSGTISIDQGQQGIITLDVAPTANLGQQIFIAFSNGVNASAELLPEVVIDIDTANAQPLASIIAKQEDASGSNETVAVVYKDQGLATLIAQVNDININDSHTFEWRFTPLADTANTDNASIPIDLGNDAILNTFEFDPTRLAAGVYHVQLTVAESDTLDAFSVSLQYPLLIQERLVQLSMQTDSDFDGIADAIEGMFDTDADGIPNYLDDNDNIASLPSGVSEQPLTTSAGYRMTLGDIAKIAGQDRAMSTNISLQDIANFGGANNSPAESIDDVHYDPIQSIQTFNIEGLDFAGQSLPVVIPLSTGTSIPNNVDYRKFNTRDGWFSFVVNRNNSIASAGYDSDGNCPLPLSNAYVSGLNVGDTCIQLVIQDGGPNDADLSANGIIKDPGVLAVELPNRSPLISVAQQTTVIEGELVSVDASLTSDPENDDLTFRWTQTGGVPISLGENTSPLLSFNAPQVDGNESLLFRLEVFDGRDTSSINLTILVRDTNTAPQVSINAHNATVDETATVSLSANVSDNDSDSLRIIWRQVSGPAVVLNGAETTNVSFVAPQVSTDQTVELQIVVSDGTKEVAATTRISIVNKTPVAKPPSNNGDSGSDSGGSMSFYLLALGFAIALFRRKNVLVS